MVVGVGQAGCCWIADYVGMGVSNVGFELIFLTYNTQMSRGRGTTGILSEEPYFSDYCSAGEGTDSFGSSVGMDYVDVLNKGGLVYFGAGPRVGSKGIGGNLKKGRFGC